MIKLTPHKPPYYESINIKKTYIALLTQAGTAAPTATIMTNTLGDIVWTRNAAGEYKGTLTAGFPLGKTWPLMANNMGGLNTYQVDNNQGNPNEIWIYTETSGTLADDLMLDTPIIIHTF